MIQDDKKRIVLCGPPAVRERLRGGHHFSFVPYGKADPAMLDGIRETETSGVLLYVDPENTDGVAFLQAAQATRPELPCFLLCHERDQTTFASHGWHLVVMTDRMSVGDIEDKLARSLFLFPLVKRDSLRRILGVLKKIPPEVENHQRIVRRLQDPEFRLDDVARYIKQDPALTAQLLKIANSVAFIREKKVQSVNEAVTVIGSAKLKALISSAWAFFLISDNVCRGFYPRKEWEHANVIADLVATRSLSFQADGEDLDTAFISAMLHDIGKLLLAANLPGDYSTVLKAAITKENGVWEAENEMFGFNHAEVGGALLALWGIPLPVAEAVLRHHTRGLPESSPAALILWAHDEMKQNETTPSRGDTEFVWRD